MEYKKNKKKFALAFKKEIALKAVSNKRKLEENKPADVWNAKKNKWTKPGSQIGYKSLTVREMFSDMKGEVCGSSDFKSCIKFVGICEDLLTTGKFNIEGNDVNNTFRVAGAGAPKKVIEVRTELFQYFVDIRSSLKARLPKKIFLTKAKSQYESYCESKREEGEEPPTMLFSNRWLSDWCKEYQVSIKKPNKRFSIKADVRKKRVADFLKKHLDC